MNQEPLEPSSRGVQHHDTLDRFEQAWQGADAPQIRAFFLQVSYGTEDEASRHNLLVELIILDLWHRWRLAAGTAVTQGTTPAPVPAPPSADTTGFVLAASGALLLEDYVKAFPELGALSDLPIELIVEEYRARLRWGSRVTEAEYLARFPAQAAELPARLQAVRNEENATVAFAATNGPAPSSGERIHTVGTATSAGTRFRILRPHAEGGLGRVSVAQDEELQREVALKEIKAQHADDPDSRARFLLEAEITGGLEHPGIVPVYGLGQYGDGRPFYAMRFIRGDSLKEAVDRYHDPNVEKTAMGKRSVERRKLLRRFLDVCNAIGYAHSRGVLHRDLKPGNIMLGPYGETLVVDWGLAKAVERPEVNAESIEGLLRPLSGSEAAATQMGSTLGTPQYMSPEQAAGRLDLLGPASDVYSLGATLYYVLTGRPPIEADDSETVLKKVMRGEFRRPRAVNPQIPRPLEAICLKAMSLKPADRYASPKALADDIEHWLADEPVKAYPEPVRTRAARWARKHKVLVAAVFGLITAAAISLGAAAVLIQRAFVNESAARSKAQRQLALSYIDHGVNELEHGEPRQGLAILGQAYRAANDADNVELRRSVCTLLGAWQSIRAHNLIPAGAVAMAFSPDGTKLAIASHDHAARLWDATTGEPLGQPMKHDNVVNVLAFSPDGSKLVTAAGNLLLSKSGEHRLWDVATCQPLGDPIKHDGVVNVLAFSPDSTKLATSEALGMITEHRTGQHRLWDVRSGKPLGPAVAHNNVMCAVAFSPDGSKFATAEDRTSLVASGEVRLWDTLTGQPVGRPIKHDAPVTTVAFSSDCTRIATSSANVVRLWNATTGQPLGAPMKHNDSSLGDRCAVGFSPDGTKVVTNGVDGFRLWDVATCQPLGQLMKHAGRAMCVDAVAFSPDGTKLATAEGDDGLQLWDATTSKPMGPPMKHDRAVKAVIFSPDGTKLATLCDEGAVGLWDLATIRLQGALQKHSDKVVSVAFSPDGSKIATASNDKTARLWDPLTGRPLGQPMIHDGGINAVAFSPDGTKVATTSLDKTARLWYAASGQPFGPPMKHDAPVMTLAFSPDGAKLVTGSFNAARLWDAATGLPLGESMKHEHGIIEAAFSPDSITVTTVSWYETRLWSAATGQPLGLPIKRESRANIARISPDGTKLVTASDDKTARLWDATTGQPLGAAMRHEDTVAAVAFSPDSTRLVTASDDKTARLWDATTGQPMGLPMKHDHRVHVVAFSPDGTKVATGSLDGARLWDAATGQPLGLPMKHDDKVAALAFSPDGTKLATASYDKTVRLWPVPQALPDDPQWVSAYVDIISGWQEDADMTIHPILPAQTQDAWHKALESLACLDQQRQHSAQFARAWHESEAAAQEATGNWFAAAFHLHWLCQLEPENPAWQQRLAKATEHLVSPVHGKQ